MIHIYGNCLRNRLRNIGLMPKSQIRPKQDRLDHREAVLLLRRSNGLLVSAEARVGISRRRRNPNGQPEPFMS
jgi:hypothetical protein